MDPGDVRELTPTLSITTPVYNCEKFISGRVESVAAQNCTEMEHVIVDGGSSDRTVAGKIASRILNCCTRPAPNRDHLTDAPAGRIEVILHRDLYRLLIVMK
jgi:glycosyltransferase involved in cell wall biosynthesis